MKYIKRTRTVNSEKKILSYQPENTCIFIPHASDNTDYIKMMEEVTAGDSTIEELELED